jgi:hypothetical protein
MDNGTVDPSVVLGLAGVAIVAMLVEAIKGLFPRLPTRALPALAIVVALALNIGIGDSLGLPVVNCIVVGLLTGKASMGFHELTRKTGPALTGSAQGPGSLLEG